MYKNILVPIVFDHEDRGTKALAVAQQLLDTDGNITLLHVMEDIPAYAAAYLPNDVMEKNRSTAVEKLGAMTKADETRISAVVIGGHAYSSILEHAQKNDVDCIVIASHKPGFEDYFLGSTAARVVRHAKCCVHILR
ncbi:universal stress protein [Roseobacter sp. YSTF-M11]|uniref:Universal stress protein n=1 Tax=Roseobacter insulae TaxID=2859783 RepID=A0A9X1JXG7_9RHOB|nr:universal stress protein [Roseobacter insulae]MBW4707220.1 universal stress protein [Roseobacter insulae]